jgi:hypothetical protein
VELLPAIAEMEAIIAAAINIVAIYSCAIATAVN